MIDVAEWLPAADPATLAAQLGQAVDTHGLARGQCVAVVAPGDYQVVQIDAPNVPAMEMRQAQVTALWRGPSR